MTKNIAISAQNVSKDFKLPYEKTNSIKGLFTSVLRRSGSNAHEMQHALKDISFEVKQGEFFGIVGRNGSGKSTLLKILAGIYQPTDGAVGINGKLVPFIELGVGFNPELTGRENVFLNGAMLGFSEKEIEAMYNDIVAFAELEEFMDKKLKNYSSGMQVRLAFSMATRSQADILLVDEVLAVGDADFQRKCFEYFRKLKKQKTTVVFVSHDMEAVREYCDRVILIEKSKLILEGKPDKVASQYTRLFNATPKDNDTPEKEAVKKRWGSGVVSFTEAYLSPSTLTDDQNEAMLHMSFKADKPSEDLVVGFRLKNNSGQSLLGTNNKIERLRLPKLQAGQTKNLAFSIPNILSEGEYDIDIALESNGGGIVCDWWEDALRLIVRRQNRSHYIITPNIRVMDE